MADSDWEDGRLDGKSRGNVGPGGSSTTYTHILTNLARHRPRRLPVVSVQDARP